MRILIVKLSSFGDIMHVFTAVTDLAKSMDQVDIDWLVDSSLKDIPKWHPAVNHVYAIPLRKVIKNRSITACLSVLKQIRSQPYDIIIDAQGLLKSMLCAVSLKGAKHGFAKPHLRESIARWGYDFVHTVDQEHIVDQYRLLFAKSVGYPLPAQRSFGIEQTNQESSKVILFIGAGWGNKRWPMTHWALLIKKLKEAGKDVECPYGSYHEKEQLMGLKQKYDLDIKISSYHLDELKGEISKSSLVVAGDTGILHLAKALGVITIGLFGATQSKRSGYQGSIQSRLECSPCMKRTCQISKQLPVPCMESIAVEQVWLRIKDLGVV